ncbi:insulin-like growth factor-binding protein 7 [Alligator sinensis]|uniref:Insulin-like growth factor-binding protein 7 n=1 Tax=Alligator sinensis TaxID=38654 RepID=A0A3Q0GZF8_ALLSI|nr:insulin-like growth factor-binding protein 7 [Alligator sinensis]
MENSHCDESQLLQESPSGDVLGALLFERPKNNRKWPFSDQEQNTPPHGGFFNLISLGPLCAAGPSIVTPPKDIWNVTGAQIYLSCEVLGIPTPVLIWNKIIRGQYGVQRMELLPGDRENLAIQTRGGPEKHEVTGWVLISPLSKEDAGEYECHASNSKGEATASAKITVADALHEIPITKDDGAEL